MFRQKGDGSGARAQGRRANSRARKLRGSESKRSAYLLREKEGAEGFAAAWQQALALGRDHARSVAIERALHGEIVPQFRNGRFTGYRTRYNDRLLVAAVSGGARAAVVQDERHRISEMFHRLERWEGALHREQIRLAGNAPDSSADTAEAWEDHLV